MTTPLARILEAQGRRHDWLARRLGVHPSTVTRWIRGTRRIPPRRVPDIAVLLGVPEEAVQGKEEVHGNT